MMDRFFIRPRSKQMRRLPRTKRAVSTTVIMMTLLVAAMTHYCSSEACFVAILESQHETLGLLRTTRSQNATSIEKLEKQMAETINYMEYRGWTVSRIFSIPVYFISENRIRQNSAYMSTT